MGHLRMARTDAAEPSDPGHNSIIPTVQTVHILAIVVVAGSALMIDLRLLGAFGADSR